MLTKVLLSIFSLTASFLLFESSPALAGFTTKYQIGSHWDRRLVTEKEVSEGSLGMKKISYATARFGIGTAFYLGKFNGKHIMATNYHVMSGCSSSGKLKLLNLDFSCIESLGAWSDLDLNLFVAKFKKDRDLETKLSGVGLKIDFDHHPQLGEFLVTAGFGSGVSNGGRFTFEEGPECRTFSKSLDVKLLNDPDIINPLPGARWSFALGCEASHGDSGSAIVSRDTGRAVGILWTGARLPRAKEFYDSNFLTQFINAPDERVWKQLNYAVPSNKMKEIIQTAIETGNVEKDHIETLNSILHDRPDNQ